MGGNSLEQGFSITAMKPHLPTLPSVRDYCEPVVYSGSELAEAIREATVDGYFVRRMDVLPGVRYKLRFLRQPPTQQDEI